MSNLNEEVEDMFNKNAVEEIPDHNEKYDIDEDALEKANAKMASLSIDKELKEIIYEEAPIKEEREKIKVGGMIIRKRTVEDYENIWESFLINAEADFKEFAGYGEDKIKEIGINKFIDANDWLGATDVDLWRRDRVHVVPCCNCDEEFSDFEKSYGLCDKCTPLFDMQYFEKLIRATAADLMEQYKDTGKQVPAIETESMASFYYDKEFREKFLRSVLDARDTVKNV